MRTISKRERRAAVAAKRTAPDFVLADHGSVAVLTPMSGAAREWRDAHIDQDAMAWGRGVVIEPRYLGDIMDGIQGDGLSVAA